MENNKDRRVTCINDKTRPNEISLTNWIVEGQKYTVIKMVNSKLTGDKFFVLNEISTGNPLYGGYNINRFGIDINDLDAWLKENDVEEEVIEEMFA
jgi:hypothetical protein